MKHFIRLLIILAGLTACNKPQEKLIGRWDDKNGLILEFKKGNKAQGIFYTKTSRDTFEMNYKADLSITPHQLDLTDIKSGPLEGKTLYGIMEFNGATTLSFDCAPSSRPTTFSPKETVTYFKMK
ncbi:MAG: hypothetical protein M3R17_13645 [Bacteroidota bacterium]|nr:hypothetical protein [Bacteroidota bacterium]